MTKRSFAWRQRQGFAIESRDPVKSTYYRELWNEGPVRREARRLARLEIRADYAKRGESMHSISEQALERAIDVLLFNSEDIFLKRAKFNLDK